MSRVTRKLLGRFGISKTDKDESTSAASDLDEEMEKVFAMSEEDKFDLTSLSATDQKTFTGRRKFSEQDYDHAHRKRSYPHTHIPLKPFKTHSWKKDVFTRESSKKTSPPSFSTDEKIGQTPNGADRQIAADEEIGELEAKNRCEEKDRIPTIHNNDEPLISERAAAEPCRESTSPDRKVQFSVGSPEKSNQEDQLNNNLANDRQISFGQDHKLKRKHSGHHHKKPRRRTHTNGEAARSTSKDENTDDGSYQFILQLEEPLDEFIQDDLTSHRFDFGKDKRRFSTKSNISSILTHRRGNESSIISSLPIKLDKKSFDHSPHEVFVQLDELSGTGDEREWKETARWIKYEEDVEVGADRWGKPHVASLSFHSLLNLRRCLENGVILLDMEEKELPAIAYRVVERMAVEELIKEEDKAVVMRSLLLKHRHVHEHDRFRFIRKNNSSYSSLQNLNEECKKTKFSVTSYDLTNTLKALSNHDDKLGHTVIDMKEETTYSSSSEDVSRKMMKERESILKRIPVGAEATTVLIGTVEFLRQPTTAFVRLAEAIHLSAVTEVSIPVRFMFILLGPPNTDVDYYEIGRSISTLMSNTDFNKKAYKAAKRKDLLSAINEFLDYSIVVPPGNWEREALLSLRELKAKNEAIRRRRSKTFESPFPTVSEKLLVSGEDKKDHFDDDPLHRTRRPFGGLINDLKRRYPYYKSDFLDGVNCLCISAAIFMYFAALSAAITFGGLIAGKTKNLIGISETLIATSIAGIIFALCSAQPLLIIGTTGPLLLFDESLFTFCQMHNIDYLTMRVYVGIWLFIIAIFVACIEGSVFIKVFTRFTEEIFSSLISLIYIFESVMSCITVFKKHPLLPIHSYCDINNSTIAANVSSLPGSKINQPNTALFCTILSLGTFFLAYYLRHFRNSKFLGRSARRALGDFGVPIAIVVMGVLAALNKDTYIEKLSVPEGLSPSTPTERGWLISPLGRHSQFQVWAMLIACIPAVLVYILLFMETNISELIIGKKERKLQKGNGFHLDITLVCLTNVVCGLIGAPWMCAATVRSVTHVSSLTVMSRTHAPGEKPHIMEVKEQRVSSLLVSIMVGLSVLMAPYLSLVPMAVLFGVFLYMGISSINGVQFFERLKLLLMPVKHHPEVAYVRRVRTFKMHLFTLIQLFCLILLWTIKSSPIALTLPFFLLLMVPLRSQLKYIFLPQELRALDSDEPNAIDKEDDDEPDFYVESVLPS